MLRLVIALAFCLVGMSALAQNGVDTGVAVRGAVQNRGTLNSSAKIATGNTFQTVLVAQSAATSSAGTTTQRQALTIENNNVSDNCWLVIGTTQITSGTTTLSTNVTIAGATITAQQASIVLLPGGSYTRYWPFVPSDAVYATCANTGDSLYVDNQ